jgi:hypothetical protein
MGKTLTDNSSNREFEILGQGTYIAVCTATVAIGWQETHFGEKEQLKVRFEVPTERIEYEKDGEQVEGPMVIWKTYTCSLNEKANLRRDLESWRGRQFTEEELAGFDIANILGKACSITIVHRESGGKTYANVSTVSGIPKGTSAPTHEGDLLDFDNENYTGTQLEALPNWLQDKIRDSEALVDRMQSRASASHHAPAASETHGNEFDDDDIPF